MYYSETHNGYVFTKCVTVELLVGVFYKTYYSGTPDGCVLQNTVVLLMGVFYKTYYSGTSGAPDGCFTGHTLMGVFYNMHYSGTPDRCVLQYVLQWN